MKAEDEIKELDQMVNDRDDLIRALAGKCDLTDEQQQLLDRICSE